MKIAIGADHAGYEEKENIKKVLDEIGVEYIDLGTNSLDSVDYPDYGKAVGEAVINGKAEEGIVVCGSGIGISIAANKVKGIRAALVWNEETAMLARQHNNANVLAIGARTTPKGTIPNIIKAWFNAKFEGGRHQNRIDKISEIEEKYC
jgi:ribose 5-phosphate isomerase B